MPTTAATLPRSTAALALLAALALAAPVRPAAARKIQTGTLIHLADGDVQGDVDGGARRFRGIPFAAPPVGPLRWRPPMPAALRQGVLAATAFAPACAQLGSVQG